MLIHFFKYHGTGNDFILLDNREAALKLSRPQIAHLCHRRFGIGADGLMLLENIDGADFKMVYYNSDGGESTMCGNGGRCIVAFAQRLGIITDTASFVAIDGPHTATVDGTIISLRMKDVDTIDAFSTHSILNTGSPHYVQWVEDVEHTPVFEEGRRIRNGSKFTPSGINVNFVQRLAKHHLHIRTYERGVEDETLSCGTGVTAAAIAASGSATGSFNYKVETPGGALSVSFTKTSAGAASEIILQGSASFVFEGSVDI